MKVTITTGLEESKRFGRISKLEFEDGSKVYISKKGWHLFTPIKKGKRLYNLINKIKKEGRCSILIPFGEIQIVMEETIKQGYVR